MDWAEALGAWLGGTHVSNLYLVRIWRQGVTASSCLWQMMLLVENSACEREVKIDCPSFLPKN